MIEARVVRLEDDVKDVKSELREIRRDMASMKETLARIDGRVAAMPTAFQFYLAILVTWGAGAGIALTLIRFAAP